MNDFTVSDPCLLFALRRESQWLRGEFQPEEVFPGAPCAARFCAPRELPELSVLVLEAGMGAARARAALQWILSGPLLGNIVYRPKLVLSVGFCGALHFELKVGDVVLATDVADLGGNSLPTTWPGKLPPGDWRPPLHRGRVLTVDRLLADAAEKQELGQKHAALAVDMESFPLAEPCRRAGVPFGCVRAVSDDAATNLSPRLSGLVAGARPSGLRLLTAVLTAPALVPELLRLRRATATAGAQLAQALGELLTLTLE